MKKYWIIIIIILGVSLFLFWIQGLFESFDWNEWAKIFARKEWVAISAIVLFATAFVIGDQALATRKLIDKTLPAKVNVGLLTRSGGTKISIYNVSEFPVWLWIDIKFFKDGNCKKRIGEQYRGKGFYICPLQPLEPGVKEADTLIGDPSYSKIYARLEYRFNITNSSNVSRLNVHFRYLKKGKEENRWIITDGSIGTEFKPLYS